MPTDYDDNLLRWALIYVKDKDYSMARRYLQRVLDMADDRETRTQANYWMSECCTDPVEKRNYLEETLANDPTHPEARRALAILDGKLKPSDIVNPDALPVQVAGTESTTADRFTCPKCGGRMVFDGDGRTLLCEYCSRNQVLSKAAPQFDQDFIMAMATGKGHSTPVMRKTFTCQGCGAHFILPAEQISVVCSYCGSAQVVALTKELIEPDSIVPMGMSKTQVAEVLIKWLEKRRLKGIQHLREPKGMYLPIWTFDLMGIVPWSGTIYRDKQKIPVSGEENLSINDVAVPGVARWKDILPQALTGLATAEAPAYDERYLAGWPAEVNEQSMSDASLDARQKAVERFRDRIRMEKGHIDDLTYSTSNLSILSFKLVLVPLWFSQYSLEGRDYRVLINGQTGNVYGETPPQNIISWLGSALGV